MMLLLPISIAGLPTSENSNSKTTNITISFINTLEPVSTSGIQEPSVSIEQTNIHSYDENYNEILPKIRTLLVNSRQSLVRQTAAWALGSVRDKEAKELIEKHLLEDGHPPVRLLCTTALIQLDDISSIPVLCKALQKDANEMTRREIANAIGLILDYQKIHDNTWDSNYYGFSYGILPKLILGLVKSKYYWEYIPGEIVYILLPGLNFDWHPARQPYDL